MRREAVTDGGQSGPDWRLPAVRCALEVTLIVLIAAYLWINVGSPLFRAVIAVLGLSGAVITVMWYVNRLSLAWVRYARNLRRRERRKRERERQKRRRRQREQQGEQ